MEQVLGQPGPGQAQQAVNPLPDAPPAPQVDENSVPVPPAQDKRVEVNNLCFGSVYCITGVSHLLLVAFSFVFGSFVSYSFR